MRVLPATSILASILISSSIAAEAGPLELAPPLAAAPTIVRVQPRAERVSSAFSSEPSRPEQKSLSRFDARRKKLNKAPDGDLSIYCC